MELEKDLTGNSFGQVINFISIIKLDIFHQNSTVSINRMGDAVMLCRNMVFEKFGFNIKDHTCMKSTHVHVGIAISISLFSLKFQIENLSEPFLKTQIRKMKGWGGGNIVSYTQFH
jgi:hypothetical protein